MKLIYLGFDQIGTYKLAEDDSASESIVAAMACCQFCYHIISYHIISYHIISYHIRSYHIISHQIISCHIISYHIISYHIISYHIISSHFCRAKTSDTPKNILKLLWSTRADTKGWRSFSLSFYVFKLRLDKVEGSVFPSQHKGL